MMPFHKTPEDNQRQDGFCGMTQRMLLGRCSEIIQVRQQRRTKRKMRFLQF